ncbi:NADPH-dependent F420 reductase [Tessaracoccus caeni]|uniref:NADPH-dependent F420 reductase n=1 Tax=Tessaracoccus caeni TaxID=3031239 RepID=UPI0023D9DB27|nr:NAD(P)-binding domain-containing protein [Tessaracoccus caeni]MDF1488592.1 NAD(P)-binding domain-containing protein [Tessaracoccus caeni]
MSDAPIGIIGSGNIGAGVARLAVTAGLTVVLANSRGPESLSDLVTELGDAASADTVEGAIAQADLVVLALPFGAYDQLPAAALAGKTVLDATNYYPDRDGHIAALDEGTITSSELLASAFPDAAVIKGMNNVDFLRLTQLPMAAGAADRTALPIAGDDADAKARVAAFLDAVGFDALDLGALAEGRRSQPGTPIYVTPYYRPAEPPVEDPMQAFVTATPVPVPLGRAQELAASA